MRYNVLITLVKMEANQEGPLKVHLVHGSKNHFLTLHPDESEDSITVRTLAHVAESLSGIPVEKQKLIYKGKTLNNVADWNNCPRLRQLGLRDGAKIMLLGSRSNESQDGASHANYHNHRSSFSRSPPESKVAQYESADDLQSMESEDVRKLGEVESRLGVQANALRDAIRQVDHTRDPRELDQLQKKLKASGEGLMRLLETLDALRFDPEDNEARARRKAVVDEIHRLMDQCEEVVSSIKRSLSADRKS